MCGVTWISRLVLYMTWICTTDLLQNISEREGDIMFIVMFRMGETKHGIRAVLFGTRILGLLWNTTYLGYLPRGAGCQVSIYLGLSQVTRILGGKTTI